MLPILGLLGLALGAAVLLPLGGPREAEDDPMAAEDPSPGPDDGDGAPPGPLPGDGTGDEIEVIHDDSGMYEDEGAHLAPMDEGDEAEDVIEVVHDDSGLYEPGEGSDGVIEAVHDDSGMYDGEQPAALIERAVDLTEGSATIDGFDAARDALVVVHDPAGEPPTLAYEVDEEGATLLADGRPVARLPGAGAIDLTAVRLVSG